MSNDNQTVANQVVKDVITLALTHMLKDAEAGENTEAIINALKHVQLSDSSIPKEHDVTLWKPNLPRFQRTVSFIPPSKGHDSDNSYDNHQLNSNDHLIHKIPTLLINATMPGDLDYHHLGHHEEGYHHRSPSIIPEVDEEDETTHL